MLGLVYDVKDVLFLPDIVFDRRAIDRGGDGLRIGEVAIGDSALGGAGAMAGYTQRPADAVGASGDNHNFARDLHRPTTTVR